MSKRKKEKKKSLLLNLKYIRICLNSNHNSNSVKGMSYPHLLRKLDFRETEVVAKVTSNRGSWKLRF